MKKRVHKFEISVTFDKSCYKAQALCEIKDVLYKQLNFGNGTIYGEADIGEFTIHVIKNAKLYVPQQKDGS